jgi:hypothetical protein
MDCNWFGLVLQVEGAAGGSLPELPGPGFGMDCNRFGLVLQVEGAAGGTHTLASYVLGLVWIVTGLVWCCRWRVLRADLCLSWPRPGKLLSVRQGSTLSPCLSFYIYICEKT